jgi:hypothetical protein
MNVSNLKIKFLISFLHRMLSIQGWMPPIIIFFSLIITSKSNIQMYLHIYMYTHMYTYTYVQLFLFSCFVGINV